LPAAVTRSAGSCGLTGSGDAQGWLVACDATQQVSYVLWPAELTNSDVASASEVASRQSPGQWSVGVTFTATGQRRFFETTQRSVGMQVALVVDGVVNSAPVIVAAVNGGADIPVTSGQPQAQLLATLIGNGALPVPLHPQGGPGA
jgi:preprotein translocase subunit SecD